VTCGAACEMRRRAARRRTARPQLGTQGHGWGGQRPATGVRDPFGFGNASGGGPLCDPPPLAGVGLGQAGSGRLPCRHWALWLDWSLKNIPCP
jgi:hypothetical protein